MDLTHREKESEYWLKATQQRIAWRDEVFKHYRELLPQSRLEAMQKEESDKPINQSFHNSKAALEGNPAFKFLVGKTSAKKILQDA